MVSTILHAGPAQCNMASVPDRISCVKPTLNPTPFNPIILNSKRRLEGRTQLRCSRNRDPAGHPESPAHYVNASHLSPMETTNYYSILGLYCYVGTMESKMETTIVD